MMMKEKKKPITATTKYFPPAQYTVDDNGNRWRLCAGAAVLNSKNELLVGERLYQPNAWQAPQGGVDDIDPNTLQEDHQPRRQTEKETVRQASDRELYEEIGLIVGTHVMVDPAALLDAVSSSASSSSVGLEPVRYTTPTRSWLGKAGFAGQEMHWTIYRCMDSRLDSNPSAICQLEGKNGEDAEFSSVKFVPIDEIVKTIWEGKRMPYQTLSSYIKQVVQRQWETMCLSLDFRGVWVGQLEASTTPSSAANNNQIITCSQHWEKTEEQHPISWTVTTTYYDTTNRHCSYETSSTTTLTAGQDEQVTYEEGMSVLFGDCYPSLFENSNTNFVAPPSSLPLRRRTFFLAEQDADPPVAYVTTTNAVVSSNSSISYRSRSSSSTVVLKEVRSYLKEGKLHVRYTSWPNNDKNSSSASSTANSSSSSSATSQDPVVWTNVYTRKPN